MRYAFWNNKGGTGKTSLAFQTITEYAIAYPSKKILVLDLCPQANLSELMMGGLMKNGGANLAQLYTGPISKSIGGYFQLRLGNPYTPPSIKIDDFLVNPNVFNDQIPQNVDLIAGDRIIELQANSISALSITQIHGIDTYIKVIDWLNDLINVAISDKDYDEVFIDTNPSFSIFTQIALAAVEGMILPVMADDSSRRALQNVFSLVYGINLPNQINGQYSFFSKLTNANRPLPKIKLIVKNRITQYMGPASAYASVLSSIDSDLTKLFTNNKALFMFPTVEDGIVEVRDFQTTGVVAFAEATPFSKLKTGVHALFDSKTQLQNDNLSNCKESIKKIIEKL